MVSQGEENVVESGAVHGKARDQVPARVDRVEQGAHLGGAAVGRHAHGPAGRVPVQRLIAEVAADLLEGGHVPAGQVQSLGSDPPFQLLGRALRDQAARVQHPDAAGQPVGFFQVLRGEEDGHPGSGQTLDDPPHGQPALRVEAS